MHLLRKKNPLLKTHPSVFCCWFFQLITSSNVMKPTSRIQRFCIKSISSFTHYQILSLCRFFFFFLSFFPLRSIRTWKLPFRPQKYDIWCSNDLQTISGNVHHESWKCIFPFPLWRGLHAQRKIYSAVAFSIAAFSRSALTHSSCLCRLSPPSRSRSPFIPFIIPSIFLYFIFAEKSPLKSCHVFTYERHEHLKRSGKSLWLFADVLLFF